MSSQIEMVSLEELVSSDHIYRKFHELWDFNEIESELSKIELHSDHKGYGIYRLFLCLLLQFIEDLSDRELEHYMKDNTSAKWFSGFGLLEKTPSYRVFSNARRRIGTKRLSVKVTT